jgi:hypothetical protein
MKKIKTIWIVLLVFTGMTKAQDFYDLNSVHEIRLYFSQSNWDHILDSLFEAGQDQRLMGNIIIDGLSYDSVGVRYKGYSSVDTAQVKNPFNIDLDCFVPDQEHYGVSKIKLSNIIHDPSFIREVLSYEMARKYMPAAKANYANVYVNDVLIGLYTNVEAINKDFAGNTFQSRNNSFFKGNPENLVYPYGSNSNLQYYDNDSSSYYPFYSLESDAGWGDLHQLINTLNNNISSIETILDVDRAIWMIAFDYSIINLDSYIGYSQNYYLYQDNNQRFNTVLWDMNMSFGSFRLSDGSYGALSGGISITQAKNLNPLGLLTFSVSPRPLVKNLLQDETRKRMYLAHIRTIINENFASGDYMTRGAELQALIDTCVQNDTNKFYSYTDFTDNLYQTVGGSGGMIEYPGLYDFMEARTTYLSSYAGFQGYPVISDMNYSPSVLSQGDVMHISVKITANDSCFLAYRFDPEGVFTKISMYDDGNHNDSLSGDSIFGNSLIFDGNIIQYYFYAENSTAGMFLPERAEYEFYTVHGVFDPMSIVINEILSENINGAKDQNNEYEDWVELYNNTSDDISLKGICLSDDSLNLYKWSFPDTVIKAEDYLIIWADEDDNQNGLHANFKMNKSGEALFMSFNQGNVIDSVILVQQFSDTTTGRYPNGTGPFVIMSPSFSSENFPLTVSEYTGTSNLLVFPNPADNYINIEFVNKDNTNISVEIFDVFGRKVWTMTRNEGQDLNEKIDISGMSNGIYQIRVVSGEKLFRSGFIICK